MIFGKILSWLLFKDVLFVWKCIETLPLRFCTTQISRQLPIVACTILAPNIHPSKDLRLTDPNVELSKSSEQSLTKFSVFEI